MFRGVAEVLVIVPGLLGAHGSAVPDHVFQAARCLAQVLPDLAVVVALVASLELAPEPLLCTLLS